VVKGVLQDGWDKLNGYQLPVYGSPEAVREMREHFRAHPDRYRVGSMPGFPFAIMRYMRRMDHFLVDVAIQPREMLRLNEMVVSMLMAIIDGHGAAGPMQSLL